MGSDRICITTTIVPAQGDWTCQQFTGLNFRDVAYNATATYKWVVTADAVSSVGKTIVTTQNIGASGWTSGPNIGSSNLTSISTIDGYYLLTETASSNLYSSTDGSSWGSPISSSIAGSADFKEIKKINSLLYAVDGTTDTVYISEDDGNNWSAISSGSGNALNDLTVSGSTLIVVGNNGVLKTSQ